MSEDFSYKEALIKARKNIQLQDIGIENNTRIRKTAVGGILIEISGKDNQKADRLAEALQITLDSSANIARPMIKGELRLINLDDSITRNEVQQIISAEGECPLHSVVVGEIKSMRNELSMVWVQCPLTGAVKIVDKKKIRIGWSLVKVEMLSARKKQYFRCWSFEHLRHQCKSSLDRSNACYKCGKNGHVAKGCLDKPNCLVCKDKGKEHDHRAGSSVCQSINALKTINTKDRVIILKDNTKIRTIYKANSGEEEATIQRKEDESRMETTDE